MSNPKIWGFAGWAADIIPYLVYGLVTVITYEASYRALEYERNEKQR